MVRAGVIYDIRKIKMNPTPLDTCGAICHFCDEQRPGAPRQTPGYPEDALASIGVVVDSIGKKIDVVNHPPHYGGDTIYEAIKVIEAWELGFCLGNTVKYISRCGKKGDEIEVLKKAKWYLEREIALREKKL